MNIELVRAWPHRFERQAIDLPEGARVGDALEAAGWQVPEPGGCAVHGRLVGLDTVLRDGDRLEILRPLQLDPKEARRRRAEARPLKKQPQR
ncbi:RnfH family protein [Marilutibacter alkalisoli]|uniref:UPF0125 protein FKV23_07670 n=1 Tax=Marilutibacter alkalisoli TaxID=2591633 RepID=A0A514BRI8_9GAMM|nr:RnfH family protein [Lysobacter alkalisoli]QDH69986.1 RnfH family protein [Lysobacter alkalisoli]